MTISKQLAEDTLVDLVRLFGPDIINLTEAEMSDLWLLSDRADKIGQWVTINYIAMNEVDEEIARGGEYLVWQTAEDEFTCPYCEPLHNKIVKVSELATYGYPPAHPNCRCTLISIEERYGELQPVVYYHEMPFDYEGWRNAGKPPFRTELVYLSTVPELQKIVERLFEAKAISDRPMQHHDKYGDGWWTTSETGGKIFIPAENLQTSEETDAKGRKTKITTLGWAGADKYEITMADGSKTVTFDREEIIDFHDAIVRAKYQDGFADSFRVRRNLENAGWDSQKATDAVELIPENNLVHPSTFTQEKGSFRTSSGMEVQLHGPDTRTFYTMTDFPERNVKFEKGGFGKWKGSVVSISPRAHPTLVKEVEAALTAKGKAGIPEENFEGLRAINVYGTKDVSNRTEASGEYNRGTVNIYHQADRDTVRHEIAHHVYYTKMDKENYDKWEAIYNNPEGQRLISAFVMGDEPQKGHYWQKNSSEGFAEAYSTWAGNGRNLDISRKLVVKAPLEDEWTALTSARQRFIKTSGMRPRNSDYSMAGSNRVLPTHPDYQKREIYWEKTVNIFPENERARANTRLRQLNILFENVSRSKYRVPSEDEEARHRAYVPREQWSGKQLSPDKRLLDKTFLNEWQSVIVDEKDAFWVVELWEKEDGTTAIVTRALKPEASDFVIGERDEPAEGE